jgi:NADH-quinone oxidoreductase subunit L
MYYAKRDLPERLTARFHGIYALVFNKYWVDEIYGALIVAPVLFIARWVLAALVDRGVIDGGGLLAGYTAQGFGSLAARIQSGNIRSYAGWLAAFAALLLVAVYFGWTLHFGVR